MISAEKPVKVEKVTALDSIEALPRWGKEDLVDGIYGKYPLAALTDSKDPGRQLIELLKRDAKELQKQIEILTKKRDQLLAAVIPPAVWKEKQRIASELARVREERKALPAPQKVYAGTVHSGSGTFKGRGHVGGKPRPIYVLARGNVQEPTTVSSPGTVDFIPEVSARFQLPKEHAEGARRVALAEWLVRRDNPLTWRSIVNRIWLYHFGNGIVDSPNDFGRMGKLPSHPELLDWLAVEFRDGGQSIKDLHRLIVTSAAYRQVSTVENPRAEKLDGGNRFLWRMNRRKLEAEALRDSILLVAGRLDRTMYGPGFRDFVLEKPEHSPHYQYHKHDPDDVKTHRRSVYRFLVRSQPQPFMDTLDCADPSFSVDKRNETLTALQALAVWNNKFVVRMAEHFSRRLEEEKADLPSRVRRGFRLTCGREPSVEEAAALEEYALAHGLSAACRVLLNLNEFAFVD